MGLEEYLMYYQINRTEDEQKKAFASLQGKLRKQIADQFVKCEKFKTIFAKELIKEDLQKFTNDSEQLLLIKEFENFTTYFTGFHENRKNMYSSEDKSTAIAYRLIHQNLPKFIDNMRAFDKIQVSPIKEMFSKMLADEQLGPIVQLLTVEEAFTLDFFNETLTQKGINIYNTLIGGFTSEDGKTKVKGLNEYINLFNQTESKEKRLPKLKPLFKQILSDRLTASFIPEEFESDNAVIESIKFLYHELNGEVFVKLRELMQHINEYDLGKIYITNDTGLTDLS